jgi:signal transduction histidine kinase
MKEAALMRSEKLAAVGRLAATVAHEINNPLESAINLLYLAEHNASLDDTAREHLRMAGAELTRAAQIARACY